jgi:hypothetical protein
MNRPYRSLPLSRRPRPSGFSLTELILGSALAAMAISLLLYLMVSLLQDNQSEQARGNVDDDLRRALDFIANDLREATYIYTGEQLERDRQSTPRIAGLNTYLPNFGAGVRPILAFWKVENLPYESGNTFPANCATAFVNNQPAIDECNKVKVERRAYTLVVYTQSTDRSGGWRGESRIERYQLRKFSDLSTLTVSPGYVDPVARSTFATWPFSVDSRNLQTGTMSATREPLVDFVARPAAGQSIACPFARTNNSLDYVATPLDASNPPDRIPDDAGSFFACVRDPRGGQSFNQDAIVFLRGNVRGRPGVTKDVFLDTLQTRAIGRGVIGKTVLD